MKLTKSILSCAVAVAMGASFASYANTDTKSASNSEIGTAISVMSTSNSMTLIQNNNNNDALLVQ
ncbi:MAG: curlin, partial [Pseudoalteromonas nigrifaciens]